MTAAVQTIDLRKSFGAFVVTDSVDFRLERGARHALIGPNGAGKTTFVNLVSGALSPSSGSVVLDEEDVTRLRQSQRVKRGLVRTFQINQLFRRLSVLENVRLAVQARAGVFLQFLGLAADRGELTDRAAAYLERVRLADRARLPAAGLNHGDQRKLEVAILLALEPDVFMFDEPTAGMSVDEVPVILDLIEGIKAQAGKTILLVEHNMRFVMSVAQHIAVLNFGSLIASGTPQEIRSNPAVIEAYLGDD